jgi:hypothetical protein
MLGKKTCKKKPKPKVKKKKTADTVKNPCILKYSIIQTRPIWTKQFDRNW